MCTSLFWFSRSFRIFRSVWDFVKPSSHHLAFLLASSVNIPWSKGGKGDVDYLYAFERVIMPIAEEFVPDIILGGWSPLHRGPFSHSFPKCLPDSMLPREIHSANAMSPRVDLPG